MQTWKSSDNPLPLPACMHAFMHGCSVTQWCPTLCDPMIETHQAPLSVEFSRKEYWSRLSFPTPGDLFHPGIEPCLLCLLHWQVDSLPLSQIVGVSSPYLHSIHHQVLLVLLPNYVSNLPKFYHPHSTTTRVFFHFCFPPSHSAQSRQIDLSKM